MLGISSPIRTDKNEFKGVINPLEPINIDGIGIMKKIFSSLLVLYMCTNLHE